MGEESKDNYTHREAESVRKWADTIGRRCGAIVVRPEVLTAPVSRLSTIQKVL